MVSVPSPALFSEASPPMAPLPSKVTCPLPFTTTLAGLTVPATLTLVSAAASTNTLLPSAKAVPSCHTAVALLSQVPLAATQVLSA